ncbi:MAG TPA: NRDE family protein [Acetobacteraceae bacterium]|nr:NRDE family protein [Acetobacteraceae bacterium]
MCTVVVLIRPGHVWPLVLAANRDERLDRAWDPPSAWWPDRPGVVGGRDRTAGGTWMAVNRHGVVAAVLNRQGSLGPAPGKRSRGELPLIALAAPTAATAANAIATRDAGQWRSFNLVLADPSGAMFVRGLGQGRPQVHRLTPGLHMVTAHDPDDPDSSRVARHLPRFMIAPAPDPVHGWQAWQDLLSDRSGEAAEQLNVVPRGGFGTVCASLLALPAQGPPIWQFSAGAPHEAPFAAVDLD